MIKARIAKTPKICLVFDTAQATAWLAGGKINEAGISAILRMFRDAGISFFEEVSAICLASVVGKAKAADYKYMAPYVEECISTYDFNVLVPVGAEAFNRVVGFKGQQKYLLRCLHSEVYPNKKVIPLQNPLQAKYDPTIMDTIKETVALIKTQCEFPEIVEDTKLPVNYQIIDSIEKWDEFISLYLSDKVTAFAYDTETKSFDYIRGELLTVQWSHAPGHAYLLPCRFYHPWKDHEWEKITVDIRKLHADESKVMIGHNIKYDNLWMRHQMGVPFRRNNVFCTQAASFLCNENEPNDLKLNAIRNTDLGDYDFELDRFIDNYCADKKNKTKKSEFTYEKIPFPILAQYALIDADASRRLYDHYQIELVKEDQVAVHAMLMKFIYLFQVCESSGWPIDLEYCRQYLEGYQDEGGVFHPGLNQRITELEEELKNTVWVQEAWNIKRANELERQNKKRKNQITALIKDVDFKLGSTPNKQALFFDVMKLPALKKTKSGGNATDKEVLDRWVVAAPEYADFLIKFREWGNLSKIRSTYVTAFLEKTIEGRIHTTYTITTAKTGRSSSKNPNLQNIPAHSAEAKKVKRAVAAPEGKVLLGADLQACEMRWCAVYSNDEKLIEIFNAGLDIHGSIAKDLFPYIECPVNEVKNLYKFERNEVSKRVQFGALYGMGYGALTRNINASLIAQLKDGKITQEQFNTLCYTDDMSKDVLSDYFLKYSGVNTFVQDTTKFVEQNGYALSLLGRKRRVPAVNSTDEGIKATAVRQAVNSVIQSIASDALLLSAYNLQCEIEDKNLPMTILGTIHDALYVETDAAFMQEAADLMIKHMKVMPVVNAPVLMDATAEWGKNWAEFSEDFGTAMVDVEDEEEIKEEVEEAA